MFVNLDGFDVNCVDVDGHTALMSPFWNKNGLFLTNESYLPKQEFAVDVLLKAGARFDIGSNGEEKNALAHRLIHAVSKKTHDDMRINSLLFYFIIVVA